MYKNQLTVYGEHLAKEQQLPASTSAEGNGGSQKAGSMLGAVEVVMVAATSVHLAENATLTLSMQESTDNTVFSNMPVQYIRKAVGGAMDFAAGDVVARLPLSSDAGKHVKAVMATDDAAATGTVNIIFEYLPR